MAEKPPGTFLLIVCGFHGVLHGFGHHENSTSGAQGIKKYNSIWVHTKLLANFDFHQNKNSLKSIHQEPVQFCSSD